jgi:hypothetical protein
MVPATDIALAKLLCDELRLLRDEPKLGKFFSRWSDTLAVLDEQVSGDLLRIMSYRARYAYQATTYHVGYHVGNPWAWKNCTGWIEYLTSPLLSWITAARADMNEAEEKVSNRVAGRVCVDNPVLQNISAFLDGSTQGISRWKVPEGGPAHQALSSDNTPWYSGRIDYEGHSDMSWSNKNWELSFHHSGRRVRDTVMGCTSAHVLLLLAGELVCVQFPPSIYNIDTYYNATVEDQHSLAWAMETLKDMSITTVRMGEYIKSECGVLRYIYIPCATWYTHRGQ